ncbi:MAG: hypothetical protein WCD79_05455 [Chthoniobacteraceae bacterium]
MERPLSKFEAILLLLLFIPAISLPLAKQIIIGEPATTALEGHEPHPFPKFSPRRKDLTAFAENFEGYYNDHFGFRSLLLDSGNILRVKYFGLSPSPDVIIGKAGWFFYTGGGSLVRLKENTGFTGEQLEAWLHFMERRQHWLGSMGIRYLFVIPRDKQTIYPEFLPSRFSHSSPGCAIDQLIAYISAHSSVQVLDLRDSLLAAKKHDQVYFTLDSHWNTVGAYAGYSAIIKRLSEWFPGLKVVDRSQYNLVTRTAPGGDLARMAGIPSLTSKWFDLFPAKELATQKTMIFDLPGFAGPPIYASFTTEITPPSPLPRAVIMRDSYANGLQPYLSQNFSRISYLYYAKFGNAEFEKALADFVTAEHPDVFIDEMLERVMYDRVSVKKTGF